MKNLATATALVAALSLLTAGCSSPQEAAGPATPVQSQAAIAKKPVTDYLAYVGGKAGSANTSLPPIKIGYVAQQGGAVEPGPGAEAGADLAVKYINEELGGVDGHPIELKKCFVASSEEEGTRCAQLFSSDSDIKGIISGAVATGVQSFYSTLAGKIPVVVGVGVTNVDRVQKNAVVLYGDGQAILAPFGTFASQVRHAKTAAIVYQESPDLSAGAASLAAAMTKVGIQVKKVGYPPTSTDLLGPLTAAGAAGADIVIPYVNPSGCVNVANALDQVGVDPAKVITVPVCLIPSVSQALGGDFPKWTYAIAASLPSDTKDPAAETYNALFAKYGASDIAGNPWTETAFGSVMTMSRALNQLGPDNITADKLLAELASFKGPLIMGAPTLECGAIKDAPGLCSSASQFFKYDGKGSFSNVGEGFLPPSK